MSPRTSPCEASQVLTKRTCNVRLAWGSQLLKERRLANASGPFSGAQPAGPWSGSTVDAICVGSLVYISGRAKKGNASQTGGAAKSKGWFGLG